MALRADDADGYKGWLALGIEELARKWLVQSSLSGWGLCWLKKSERDSLIGWQLGVSL